METRKFIDAHVHGFIKPADKNHFKKNIHALLGHGLEKIIIAALPYHDFDYQLKLSLAPPHIQPFISKDNFDETRLLAAWTEEYRLQKIVIPFCRRPVRDGKYPGNNTECYTIRLQGH